MEPTQPYPPQSKNGVAGDHEPDAGIPAPPETERSHAERGSSSLSAADPVENTHPEPTLAYVRPTEIKHRALWPRRLMLIIFVVFCMEVGIMLAVLPWKQIWTSNPFVLRYPVLRAFLGNYFVRGLFSGLGMLDLWVGIWEAVHYSEE